MTQGLSFIMLIIGLLHSEMKQATRGLSGKSVDDCLLSSRFAKAHKVNNRWNISNVKKELKDMMEYMHVDFENEIKKINKNL